MTGRGWMPRASDERGAVAVLVALILGTAVMLLVWFVINIGNWYDHQRHLQLQADAAAMAGAGSWDLPCSNTTIDDAARQYSGLPAIDGGYTQVFNTQLGSGSTVTESINSDTYPDGTSSAPVDSTTYTGNPCSDGVVDVKMQESGLGWFYWATGIGPTIHAHARASLLSPPPESCTPTTLSMCAVPLGVPEENPTYAEVFYYDEATGAQIATATLNKHGVDSAGRQIWDDVSSTNSVGLSVNLASASSTSCGSTNTPNERCIGVRVAISSYTGNTTNLTGNMATDCPTTPAQWISCYTPSANAGSTASNPDLFHIRAWTNTAATATIPVVRDVQLETTNAGGNACSDAATGATDPYFTNASSANTTCKVDIQADVDFADTSNHKPAGGTVCALIGTSNCNQASLAYQGTGASAFGSGTSCPNINPTTVTATDECWTASGTTGGSPAVAISTNQGDQQIDLQVSDNAMGSGSTALTVKNVARAFTTLTSDSGPILAATSYTATQSADAESFRCTSTTSCPVSLFASFHLQPAFQPATSVSDPPVLLRTLGNGSQTQSLSCFNPDSPNDFKTQFVNGCIYDSYTPNTGTPCTSLSQIMAAGMPFQCAQAGTGGKTALDQAMNTRFSVNQLGTTCSPNNWTNFEALSAIQQTASTDPRKIFVITMPFGSFAGANGVGFYPVIDIAEFYVTQWQGGSGNNASICSNVDTGYNNTDPYYDGPLQEGDILGHFVQKLEIGGVPPSGGGGCSLADLNGCGIYLTQ